MHATPQHLQHFARRLTDAHDELTDVRVRLLTVLGADGWAGIAHDQFLVAGQAAAARLGHLAGRCDDLAGRATRLAGLFPLGFPLGASPGLGTWPPAATTDTRRPAAGAW